MKVVALISGGKDSCYNMMQCVQHGHEIVALANLKPEEKDELDSYMFQTVGHHAIDLYAEAMDLPLYRRVIKGSAVEMGRDYKTNAKDEVEDLYELLTSIKQEIEFEAVSVGAILSDYQRVRVEHVCSRLGISSLAYLWRRDQKELYEEMVASGIVAIIIKVAVMGLSPKRHLGMTMEELFPVVCKLNSEIGMNICGEGGEFESFTLDCPLFKKKIVIDDLEIVVHSDDAFAEVGFLHFNAMHLEDKPENQNKTQEELVVSVGARFTGDTIENIPTIYEDLFVTQRKRSGNEPTIVLNCPDNLDELSDDCLRVNESGGFIWISEVLGRKCDGTTIEDISACVMERLSDKVGSLGVSLGDTVLMHLFVKDMSDFGKVNSVYKKYFPHNPPARACIEMDLVDDAVLKLDCLLYRQPIAGHCHGNRTDKDDPAPVAVREAMHVQSISHWASANIGPYSQAIKIEPLMFVSGNIGLWPASMQLVEGGTGVQAALSLRHVDRIISAFSHQDSLLEIIMGFCYVTCSAHIATARKAWEMALDAKRTATSRAGDQINGLMIYLVVPKLPKGALVEWQVTSSHNSQSWKRSSSSICCTVAALEFHGVWCHDRQHCGVVNCTVSSTEGSIKIDLHNILTSYVKELLRVSSRHGLTSREILTLRIFYVKPILQGPYKELWKCVHSTLEVLLHHATAFTLLPVNGLEEDAIMMLSCWFQS